METREIFENGHILTLEAAKSLVGKRIAITSPVYKANTPAISQFTIKGFISEWDDALSDKEVSGFNNRQEYWASYMKSERIDELKSTMLIVSEYSRESYWSKVGIRCDMKSSCFKEPTFHDSDADRTVYYIEISDEN